MYKYIDLMVDPECVNEVNVYRPNGWPRMCKWCPCSKCRCIDSMVDPKCVSEVNVYRPNDWPRMCKWGQRI